MTTIYHLSDWHLTEGAFDAFFNARLSEDKSLLSPDLIVLTGDMLRNFNNFKQRIADNGQYEAGRQRRIYKGQVNCIRRYFPGVDIYGVRGNHDWCDYSDEGNVMEFVHGNSFKWKHLTLAGFRGVPFFHGNWNDEFQEQGLEGLCDMVPKDTDILVTHAPPYSLLDDAIDARCFACGKRVTKDGLCADKHMPFPDFTPPKPRPIGSYAIRNLVETLPNLKAHLFGHVHECGGRVESYKGVIYSNASCTLNQIVLP